MGEAITAGIGCQIVEQYMIVFLKNKWCTTLLRRGVDLCARGLLWSGRATGGGPVTASLSMLRHLPPGGTPPRGEPLIDVVVAIGGRRFREGLTDVLSRQPATHVVATAADVESLDDALRRTEPDVLLADVGLVPATAGVQRLLAMSPGLRVGALGDFVEPSEVVAYAEAGVAGFVTRDQSLGELVTTLQSVVRGHLHCPPQVAAALLQRVASVASGRGVTRDRSGRRLTAREFAIVGGGGGGGARERGG